MKNLYVVLFVFFCSATIAFGQTVDVVTNLSSNPTFMDMDGNDMYFAMQNGDILKVDITAATPTPTTIMNIGGSAFGLAKNGDDLYVSDNLNDKIVKIDLSSATPTAVDVVTGIGNPTGLLLVGNDLYIAARFDDKVYKIDISLTSPTLVEVASGINANAMAIRGSDLYIADSGGKSVQKLDIATSTLTTVFLTQNDLSGIEFIGDELHITDFIAGKIIKINVTDATPTAVDVATGLTGPYDAFFDGADLYITEYSANKISKLNIFAVSTNQANVEPEWNVFPNPVTDVLNFKDLTETLQYQIINSVGQVVQEGTANPNEMLSVNDLSSGMYAIRLENGELRKFMKQ